MTFIRAKLYQPAGDEYQMEYTPQRTPADWNPILYAANPEDPAGLDTLTGTGMAETVFVDPRSGASGFFRVRSGATTP